ncbi:hypothetical protein, partial [Geomonas sp.]|uniref:hypothetical protein n=1 Tax=Geomonas sp. TaxID=2651584 RepID=UPI002BE4852C|nr:hypothetical protein [Geomonas sp.]
IPASAPLRAGSMVSGDGSTIKIAVTPLTELAYRQAVAAAAGGTPIGTAITNANNQVSSTFGIDVLQVQPVDATQTALEGATMEQRAYVLALAGISQLSMTGNLSLADTIGHMMQSEAPATDVTTAQNDFLANNSRNRTGYKRMTAALSLAGLGSLKAGAVDFTITLPLTSMVNTSNGALASCEYTLSDAGSANSVLATTRFTPATANAAPRLRMIVINTNLISDGQFATLHFNVPFAAAARDLQVQNLAVKDQNGATITGVTLTVQ